MSVNSKRRVSLLVCVLLLAAAAFGCIKYSDTMLKGSVSKNADEELIDENGMIETIKELTSDKYKGRMAGTEGNEAAAEYIADRFRSIGLKKPKGLQNYMQLYPQTVITLNNVPELAIVDEAGNSIKEFDYVEDFALRSLSSSTDNIDIDAPLYEVKNLNELTADNEEIKGKMLLIAWKLRGTMPFYEIIDRVHECGAAGAVGEYDTMTNNRLHGAVTMTPMLGPWLSGEHSPFINVGNNAYRELLGALDKGYRISYKCSFKREDGKKVPNVVGLLPGSDKELSDEYIIIGAHFDHVGDNLDGTYNPGGLDNASGVAAMLEVARVLKENGRAPKKPVLFIAFNGEEGGLLGSQYYAENPVYPIDKSVMINMDMVGSSETVPLMVVAAEGSRIKLQNEIYGYCKEFDIYSKKGINNGSDHYNFAQKGVNSVLLINEDFLHGYHTPADTVEDVDKAKIEEVVKLVLHYIDKNAY